jgi:hypothetical protein
VNFQNRAKSSAWRIARAIWFMDTIKSEIAISIDYVKQDSELRIADENCMICAIASASASD